MAIILFHLEKKPSGFHFIREEKKGKSDERGEEEIRGE